MRLFITHKEQSLIADWTREFMKDMNGQTIFYYPVSTIKSNIDSVYDETLQKIFENPIRIECLADQKKIEQEVGSFGVHSKNIRIDIYLHLRDLVKRNIVLNIGDFFVYGDTLYEIANLVKPEYNSVFGQEEYEFSILIKGEGVGPSTTDFKYFQKAIMDGKNFQDSKVQKTFVQQRGLAETEEGKTGDVRDLHEQIGEQLPEVALIQEEGPRKVGPVDNNKRNSIYNE